MEENAQLRAEKMLTASNQSPASTINNVSLNMNNIFYNPNGQQGEDMGLYSTVKNKKFNMPYGSNVHNLKLNSFSNQEAEFESNEGLSFENGNFMTCKTDSPTHKSKNKQLSKKVYLTIDNNSSDSSSNDFNLANKNGKSNSCISDAFDW